MLGLYTLNEIIETNPSTIVVGLWNPISLSFRLGIIAFVALIPHIWNTLELLKPSTIMEKLSQEITMETIQAHQANWRTSPDPFQPITDIIISSLNKHDYTTLSEGLDLIRRRLSFLFNRDSFKNTQAEIDVLNAWFGLIRNLRELAIHNKDNNAKIVLINTSWIIGIKLQKNNLI